LQMKSWSSWCRIPTTAFKMFKKRLLSRAIKGRYF